MSISISLGTTGWNLPGWADTFYPQDMPEEWHLSYFNTQFACVFLPEADWRGVEVAVWQNWAEDTHEAFVFLLENALPEELPAALGGRVRGLSTKEILWFDRSTPLRELATNLKEVTHSTWLISQDGDPGQIAQVRTLLEIMGF